MKTCQICNKSIFDEKSFASCPIFEHDLVCIKHCMTCDYINMKNGHFRCTFKKERKNIKEFKGAVILMNEIKELTYHFKLKAAITEQELEDLKQTNEEFKVINTTAITEYHTKLEHTDDFVLCRFLEEIKEIERKKDKKIAAKPIKQNS